MLGSLNKKIRQFQTSKSTIKLDNLHDFLREKQTVVLVKKELQSIFKERWALLSLILKFKSSIPAIIALLFSLSIQTQIGHSLQTTLMQVWQNFQTKSKVASTSSESYQNCSMKHKLRKLTRSMLETLSTVLNMLLTFTLIWESQKINL